MNRSGKWLTAATLLLSTALFVGCGTTNPANSPNPTTKNPGVNSRGNNTGNNTVIRSSNGGKTMIIGGKSYSGSANLSKFEQAAKAHPKDAQAQMQAGIAAHVNGKDDLAVQYYKKAITVNPKDGVAYNNIGNIYYRDRKNAKDALPYYQKATQVQPDYLFGWMNLAMVQASLGNKSAAKATANEGLKKVSKSDPNYKNLEKYAASLK